MSNRTGFVLVLLVLLAALATGCNLINPAPAPTLAPIATSKPAATVPAPTSGPALATPLPTQVPDTTVAAQVASPTAPSAPLPTLALATATRPPVVTQPTAAPAVGQFTHVKIYLIAMQDNGRSGPPVGCGDSAIAVDRQIPPTNGPLAAALNQLLSLHSKDYGQSGLYNALYQSNLQLSSVAIINGLATIRLTGKLQSGGVCDDPRIIAQLTQTALQFSTVRTTAIYVNGTPIQALLSGKGP
ncbi:MAG: GerMN domain-containing protein [Anaerolineae bacterium]